VLPVEAVKISRYIEHVILTLPLAKELNMKSLPQVLKVAGVLLSLVFGVFMGIVKLLVLLFADEERSSASYSSIVPMGETSFGTVEHVAVDDDNFEIGSMSGQPIVRHL
jgi:hypothetical protein